MSEQAVMEWQDIKMMVVVVVMEPATLARMVFVTKGSVKPSDLHTWARAGSISGAMILPLVSIRLNGRNLWRYHCQRSGMRVRGNARHR